jgi:hypothetical protein
VKPIGVRHDRYNNDQGPSLFRLRSMFPFISIGCVTRDYTSLLWAKDGPEVTVLRLVNGSAFNVEDRRSTSSCCQSKQRHPS